MEICRKDKDRVKLHSFLRKKKIWFTPWSIDLTIVTIKDCDFNPKWKTIVRFDSESALRKEKETVEWFGRLGAALGKEYRRMEGK